MPSVISTHSSSSEMDFIADDKLYFDQNVSHNNSTNEEEGSSARSSHFMNKNIKQQQQRPHWFDPDDEFSVPIHTELPLITKRTPLKMSSFLFNYRTMHRSIEIMTPPSRSSSPTPTSSSSSPSPSSSSLSLCPTIPEGPIYIHHRSTKADSPLSSKMRQTNAEDKVVAAPAAVV
ncbi:hypothetical protein BG004_002836, partial [Podila humilis]